MGNPSPLSKGKPCDLAPRGAGRATSRAMKGCTMKRFAIFGMCLGVALFAVGCSDTVKKKDKMTSETTVKENTKTGEQTTEEKEDFSATDSATGAEVTTSTEEETTVKPAQRDRNGNGTDEAAGSDTTEPGTEKTLEDDAK